ncbi:hypothetical protein [Pedobacter sp. Leaf194]|uniref:hypothetical protein n=1 Tax=Pedobacter sp. Leaf194 TaxID=1736297 RepID=UPI0007039368|nr:hypothetical protein [Pedobacter sp. Leaf194]KQS41748.1 hypothetical protein ASG14_04675 [Pedobacter sp. Leaf194]
MQQVLVNGGGEISYKVLSEYHFTAKHIYESRTSENQPIDTNFEFDVIIPAMDLVHAEEIFTGYCNVIDGLCGRLHIGHLSYITSNIIEWEGNFVLADSMFHKVLRADISLLINLMNLKENTKNLNLEISHVLKGRDFDYFTKIQNPLIISGALSGAIDVLFNSIKHNYSSLPIELADQLRDVTTPTISLLQQINLQLIDITEKAFRSQLLYTVCVSLRNYLKKHSPLTHPTANLTNDQARVIYETCKLHGLINLPHEMDIEKINYMRSIISNSTHQDTMLIKSIQSPDLQ